MKEESEKTYTYYRKAQYHETDQMGIIPVSYTHLDVYKRQATKKDKKMEAGHIKFILMDGIGKSFIG